MIKRRNIWLYVPILLCLLLWTAPEQAMARKYAALVMDASTGEVLHSRRARDKRYPASITKVMTLYMLFEAIQQGRFTMESRLKVSRKATHAPPSKLGLGRGTTIKVKDAIGTLITKSANDVAVVVAEAVSGTEKKFAAAMTKKARALGMKNTTFRNASGLHHSKQVTTAHDIATLAQRIRKDFPKYYPLFKMRSYTFRKQKYYNHNKLLRQYPGAEGLKTGFINASGFNLVAVAKRNNQRVITVVFGGKTGKRRDRQVRKLLDLGFARLPNLSVIRTPLRRDATGKSTKVAMLVPRVPLRAKGVSSTQPIAAQVTTQTAELDEGIEIQWQDVTDTPTSLALKPTPKPIPKPVPQAEVSETDGEIELQFSIIE